MEITPEVIKRAEETIDTANQHFDKKVKPALLDIGFTMSEIADHRQTFLEGWVAGRKHMRYHSE